MTSRVAELEPNVSVHSALLSPNTGIADFAAVEGDAEAAEKETAPAKSILEKGDAENIAEE